jgi:CheY-like chemotaxis protein
MIKQSNSQSVENGRSEPMGKRILVIEDDEDILEILSFILTEEGYEVSTLTDGGAIDTISEDAPDLIICDIWLPHRKGTEICKILKADPLTSKIPFILISTTMNLPQIARNCGADAHVEKPFHIQEMVNIVKAYLK